MELTTIAQAEFDAASRQAEAKKILADEATRLCRGADAAAGAARAGGAIFERKGVDGALLGDLPTVEVERDELDQGVSVVELFRRAGLAPSNGEARRLIRGGGARVNFERFALDAALAIPLSRVGFDDRKPDPRFLISLTSRLWPWSYR